MSLGFLSRMEAEGVSVKGPSQVTHTGDCRPLHCGGGHLPCNFLLPTSPFPSPFSPFLHGQSVPGVIPGSLVQGLLYPLVLGPSQYLLSSLTPPLYVALSGLSFLF